MNTEQNNAPTPPASGTDIIPRVNNETTKEGAPPPAPESAAIVRPDDGYVLIRTEAIEIPIIIPHPPSEAMYRDLDNYKVDDFEFFFPLFLREQATAALVQNFVRIQETNGLPPCYCEASGARRVNLPGRTGNKMEITVAVFINHPRGLHGMCFEKNKVSHVPWEHGGAKILEISGDSGIFRRVQECDESELCQQPKKPAWQYGGPPPM